MPRKVVQYLALSNGFPAMISETVSRSSARHFYNLWGQHYDWFSFYEARAKECALEMLGLQPGQRVLNVGLGTGKEHLQLQAAIAPGGLAFGVDLSRRMLFAARERTGAPLCEADGLFLPYGDRSFERLLCAYVLDLIPAGEILNWLEGFRRVLAPGGMAVLLSLTEGVDPTSRAFVGLWKAAYTISPISCGGCRPLQLSERVLDAGFASVERKIVVQFGVPSEIVLVRR